MKGDPVLAERSYTAGNRKETIRVFGGLHYIKGNKAPYFSLTCEYGTPRELERGDGCGGAAHEEVHKRFGARFDTLAALHLSGIDGTPSYALENGFFWFYQDGGYRGTKPTWAQRVERIARHFRIAPGVVESDLLPMMGHSYSQRAGMFLSDGSKADAKARLAAWVDTQRPRWKAEADACIARHGLVVFGDPWTPGE